MTAWLWVFMWVVGTMVPSLVFAQQAPSSGSVFRDLRELKDPPRPPTAPSATIEVMPELRPAMPEVSGLSIDVKAFRISGLTVLKEQELLPLLVKRLGPDRRFADLEAAANIVAERLRSAGYFLAHAYLPAQEIKDGVVEIAVLEGRIGRVPTPERNGDIPVSESAVASLLSVLEPGTPIREDNIERTLFLVGDLKGLQVRSVLQPGETVGTADLLVTLSPPCPAEIGLRPLRYYTDCRVEATAEADNFGSRFTGELRTGGSVTWNSPLHRGDSFSVRGLFSTNGGLAFGRAGYLIPVGPYGTKIGAAYSKLTYQLGTSSFQNLDAHGSADVSSLFASHPIVRGRNLNLFMTLGYDHRQLEDKIGTVALVNQRNLEAALISLVGDSRDRWLGGGINGFSLGMTLGRLDIRSPLQRSVDVSSGRHTNGSYPKGIASFTRLQELGSSLLGFISVMGQMTSKNLDSSEKMSLGGPDAVRAYALGEAASDEGVLFTAELRFPVSLPQKSPIPGDLVMAVFFDGGYGRVNKEPLLTDVKNQRTLSGTGLGLTWGRPDDFLLRATVAWRLSEAPLGDPSDRLPRVYVQMSKSF